MARHGQILPQRLLAELHLRDVPVFTLRLHLRPERACHKKDEFLCDPIQNNLLSRRGGTIVGGRGRHPWPFPWLSFDPEPMDRLVRSAELWRPFIPLRWLSF